VVRPRLIEGLAFEVHVLAEHLAGNVVPVANVMNNQQGAFALDEDAVRLWLASKE